MLTTATLFFYQLTVLCPKVFYLAHAACWRDTVDHFLSVRRGISALVHRQL